MTAARIGITVPLDEPLGAHGPVLRKLRAAGYTDFWTAETARCDAFTPLAYAAGVLDDGYFGTAIASVFARGPGMLAMSAAALAEAAPGRFALGVGASSPLFAEDWNAAPYDRPLARVRDTVRFLRRAFAGDRVDEYYETFRVAGFRLERAPGRVPPILVAALRPGMIRLAAREADGLVLNWLGSRDLPKILAEYTGAGGGSSAGPAPEVAARIFVCVSSDTHAVRTAARRLIATYATVPAYARFHEWLGRGDALAETWRAWSAGDRKAAAAAVPDEVVDELVVHGSVQECAAGVQAYAAAGVTRPIVKLLSLDPARDPTADALALGVALRDGDDS